MPHTIDIIDGAMCLFDDEGEAVAVVCPKGLRAATRQIRTWAARFTINVADANRCAEEYFRLQAIDPTAVREVHVRNAFIRLPQSRATAVRAAYYKAMEGLKTLATELEAADLDANGIHDHVLIAEHLVACAALEAMDKSRLGAIV